MARPLRIEFAGALYHVTARGNAREDIYRDDADRQQFLRLLWTMANRHDWYCHAYCLMDNHYHLLVETNTPTLSKGMKLLNGTYTQYFNRQHRRVGHVFQGRFKAILVQKDAHLLELAQARGQALQSTPNLRRFQQRDQNRFRHVTTEKSTLAGLRRCKIARPSDRSLNKQSAKWHPERVC